MVQEMIFYSDLSKLSHVYGLMQSEHFTNVVLMLYMDYWQDFVCCRPLSISFHITLAVIDKTNVDNVRSRNVNCWFQYLTLYGGFWPSSLLEQNCSTPIFSCDAASEKPVCTSAVGCSSTFAAVWVRSRVLGFSLILATKLWNTSFVLACAKPVPAKRICWLYGWRLAYVSLSTPASS